MKLKSCVLQGQARSYKTLHGAIVLQASYHACPVSDRVRVRPSDAGWQMSSSEGDLARGQHRKLVRRHQAVAADDLMELASSEAQILLAVPEV